MSKSPFLNKIRQTMRMRGYRSTKTPILKRIPKAAKLPLLACLSKLALFEPQTLLFRLIKSNQGT